MSDLRRGASVHPEMARDHSRELHEFPITKNREAVIYIHKTLMRNVSSMTPSANLKVLVMPWPIFTEQSELSKCSLNFNRAQEQDMIPF